MSRILIVGDIPALNGKLQSLYELGHEIDMVDTGQDALWHIEERGSGVNVVIAAEQLADMDGFDLIRATVRSGLPAPAIVLIGDRNTPLVTVRTSRDTRPDGGDTPMPASVAQIIALLRHNSAP
jgi:DNA-binding NtrC family response regulator